MIDSVTPSNLFTVAARGLADRGADVHDQPGHDRDGHDHAAHPRQRRHRQRRRRRLGDAVVHDPDRASAAGGGQRQLHVDRQRRHQRQRPSPRGCCSAAPTTRCSAPRSRTAARPTRPRPRCPAATCTTTTASGGNVVLNTNGTFTYDPPAGFTGADHFFYRLTNSGGTSTGDVTVTVSDMIWFVNNDAAGLHHAGGRLRTAGEPVLDPGRLPGRQHRRRPQPAARPDDLHLHRLGPLHRRASRCATTSS